MSALAQMKRHLEVFLLLTWVVAVVLAMTVVSHPAWGWQHMVEVIGSGLVNKVSVDQAGDLIAAGVVGQTDEGFVSVIKFSGSNGGELWRAHIEGSIGERFDAMCARVNQAGDVIAVGKLDGPSASTGFAVFKLAGATGAEIWRQEVQGKYKNSGTAFDLAFDASGDILVVGVLDDNFAFVKFSGSTGSELWRAEFSGIALPKTPAKHPSEQAYSVAVDADGNAIAAGWLQDNAYPDDPFSRLAVIKVSGGNGAELWRVVLAGSGAVARSVKVDASGNVFVAGYLEAKFFVAKLHGTTGGILWQRKLGGLGSSATAVAIDDNGDVTAVGGLVTASETVGDFAVVKFAGPTGIEMWRAEIDGTVRNGDADNGDAAYAVAVDSSGDATAVGVLSNAGPAEHSFTVAKFSGSTGAALWRREFNGPENNGANSAYSVALNATGDPVVGGRLASDSEGTQAFAVITLDGEFGTQSMVTGEQLLFVDKTGASSLRSGAGTSSAGARVINRSLVGISKDRDFHTPPPGSAGDPILAGAGIRLTNPTTGESTSFALPAGPEFWRGLGYPPGSRGYVYKDPKNLNGPCRSILARSGRRLGVRCSDRVAPIPFSLDEPAQGSLILSVQFGTDAPQCMYFGGQIVRDSNTGPGGRAVYRAKKARQTWGVDCPVPQPVP